MLNKARRAGYSLLEVILALAILGGAIAVLGEAARQALDNAQAARRAAQAQLLCESKMSEILSGLTPAENEQGVARDSSGPDEPAWLYRIESEPLEEDGLLAVRVTISQDLPAAKHPAAFSLVRWVSDSGGEETSQSEAEETGGQESNSGGE